MPNDKEAHERIREIYEKWHGTWSTDKPFKYVTMEQEILAELRELGYLKLSGEPPLLSDEKIKQKITSNGRLNWDAWYNYATELGVVAQAQRKADIKWYTN